MRPRTVPADVWELAGYRCTGPARIRFLSLHFLHPARVSRVVARSAERGAGWFLFSRKIEDPSGWYVSHYKTRTAAEAA